MNTGFQHNGKEFYLEEFQHSGQSLNKSLDKIRTNAINRFSELGFPTTKNEEWKYTSVNEILVREFHMLEKDDFSLTQNDIKPFLFAGKDSVVLVIENGRFNQSLSTIPTLQNGIIIGRLADHLDHPEVSSNLAKHASYNSESFVALNTAFLNDGTFVFIPHDVKFEKPVHILNIQDCRKMGTVAYPRNLIVAGKNAELKIAETYHSIGDVNYGFTNSVTEIVIGDNAHIEFDKIQSEQNGVFHIAHTEAILGKDALFNTSTITVGGAIVRNNLHIVMSGTNGTSHLYGLYVTEGNQHVDNHTLVDHAVPQCYSNELYKGILDDSSQGVFNGKILVRKDAQKTNAYQSNKNLLLSDQASMNAKPQLEIFADDVKCSHGATTGQMDKEALFYLRSRGIGEQVARAFLNIAFAADVINNITIEPLKEMLMQLIENKLKKENE